MDSDVGEGGTVAGRSHNRTDNKAKAGEKSSGLLITFGNLW